MIHVNVLMLKMYIVREGVRGRYDLDENKEYTLPLEEADALINFGAAVPLSVVCTDDDGKVASLAQTTLEGLNFIVSERERLRVSSQENQLDSPIED